MEYYHNLVTQKSWEELQKLQKNVEFTLIGGWAVYLYTKTLKSKDIDIIIDYGQLPVVEKHYRLLKNDRLKKYEAVKDEVQIDIYLPNYSSLGIPVEDLIFHMQQLEGFKLLDPNYLSALKIYTLAQRGRSPKGRKDLIDFLSLVSAGKCDLVEVGKITKKYELEKELAVLGNFLNEQDKIPELNLNPHFYSKLKKEIISKLHQ